MGNGLLVKPETALAILSLGELFTEISHDTCTTISLRSGRLAVVSLSKLVWPLLLESPKLATFVSQMFWLTTSFLPAVGCSLTLYSCCSLERVCPSGFGRPVLPFICSYVTYLCGTQATTSLVLTTPAFCFLRRIGHFVIIKSPFSLQ